MSIVNRTRIYVLLGALGLGLAAVVGKLAYVQVVKHDALSALATQKQYGRAEHRGMRGEIVDAGGEVLALSVPAVSLYAHPPRLTPEARAKACEALRAANLMAACAKLDSDSPFVWLARRVPREQALPLLAVFRGHPGLGAIETTLRRYPKGQLAAQLIGFVGVDDTGLEGIERALDDVLRPRVAQARVLRDARRKPLLSPDTLVELEAESASVELTIDAAIQALVEESLDRALATYGGQAAIALVADAHDGAIRAAAVRPGYDPNHFEQAGPSAWRARFATDAFEPGSTIKPLVLAMALQAGHALHEIVFAENGKMLVDEHTIKDDHEPYGWLSLRDVVVKSSNIGAVKMGFMLGKEQLHAGLKAFGFGEKLGVRLPSEARGILRDYRVWSALDWATLSFGQGMSVSPLQLLSAYLMVANDGVPVRPYFVRRIYDSGSGRTTWEHQESPVAPWGSPRVFAHVRDVLYDVVEKGTGRNARVEGLAVGGKTGTAQKPDLVHGGYREGSYLAWFVGMFPIDAPRWVAVVLVDEPSENIYGGQVAAPVFKEIAEAMAFREGLLKWDGWQAAAATAALPVAMPPPPSKVELGVMPDLRGMSLRDVGRVARSLGAVVVPLGSGAVMRQQPEPGTKIPMGTTWRVELEPVEAS